MCITCTFSRVLSFLSLQQACFIVAVSRVDSVVSPLREESQQVCQQIWDGIGEWNHGRVYVFLCLCVCVCACVCVCVCGVCVVCVCVCVCVCELFYVHVFKYSTCTVYVCVCLSVTVPDSRDFN